MTFIAHDSGELEGPCPSDALGNLHQRPTPRSEATSVMTDINGGTWVFEKIGDHTYDRRRVQVRYVVDDFAVLESGPVTGAKIVTGAR